MADVRKREKIVKEIEKTSESIRKKYRALKTDRIDESIALNRHFKPLIEPRRLFVDSPGVHATKRKSRDEDIQRLPINGEERGTGTRGEKRSERDVRAFHDSA